MEFYAIASASFSPSPSFNSQRDGILRSLGPVNVLGLGFQFPTGWNSTQNTMQASHHEARFNSQRDGILQEQINIGSSENYLY